MYRYYCSEPGCRGHLAAFERCADVRAFALVRSICRDCLRPAAECPSCRVSPAVGAPWLWGAAPLSA